jgi:hypothetical protein
MMVLDADTPQGQAYLHDQEWARRFAHANRLAMSLEVIQSMRELFKVEPIESTMIACDQSPAPRGAFRASSADSSQGRHAGRGGISRRHPRVNGNHEFPR